MVSHKRDYCSDHNKLKTLFPVPLPDNYGFQMGIPAIVIWKWNWKKVFQLLWSLLYKLVLSLSYLVECCLCYHILEVTCTFTSQK